MAAIATFFENLWLSIFEPGPTPTLLVATNASFAALQLLLFVLLVATHSIHFVILSTLCGGLWWAINWFAVEIRAAQAKEEEAKRIREARRDKEKGKAGARDGDAMDSGDDTEVDTEVEEKKPKLRANPPRAPRPETESTVFVEKPVESVATLRGSTPVQSGSANVGASTGLKPAADDKVKQRRSMGESTGDLSTDSEWEKLSQDSGDR
ncbi:SMK killer toxin resistance protein [Kalmusia sp. IMI 367209]|nr:SMK killer toxin resistance protein [Kalmusia sp. IMI 367209]